MREIKRNAQYHRQQQKCQPAPCPGQNLPDLIVDLLFSVMSICYFLMPHSFVRHVFMWNFLIHRPKRYKVSNIKTLHGEAQLRILSAERPADNAVLEEAH